MSPTTAPRARRRAAPAAWRERLEDGLKAWHLLTLIAGIIAGGISLSAAGYRAADQAKRDHHQIIDNTVAIRRIERHLLFQTCVAEAAMDSVSPRACAAMRPPKPASD